MSAEIEQIIISNHVFNVDFLKSLHVKDIHHFRGHKCYCFSCFRKFKSKHVGKVGPVSVCPRCEIDALVPACLLKGHKRKAKRALLRAMHVFYFALVEKPCPRPNLQNVEGSNLPSLSQSLNTATQSLVQLESSKESAQKKSASKSKSVRTKSTL